MPLAADWTFIRFPQFQLALVAPQTERINDAASAQMVQAVCGVDAQVRCVAGCTTSTALDIITLLMTDTYSF